MAVSTGDTGASLLPKTNRREVFYPKHDSPPLQREPGFWCRPKKGILYRGTQSRVRIRKADETERSCEPRPAEDDRPQRCH